jgi:hypothetical protein
MVDALATIPPEVLAAALLEVEGVEFDLSTAEGATQAAASAERLMQDAGSLERLLAALERHGNHVVNETPLPATFGRVAMEADALPAASAWLVPPVGSAEFDAFVSEPVPAMDEQGDLVEATAQPSPPSLLGFDERSIEPVPIAAMREFDSIFLDVQRQLRLRARKTSRQGFWERLSTLFSPAPPVDPPLHFTSKAVRNFTTVTAHQGSSTKILLQSIASGEVLFVQVRINGAIKMKDRITLADRRTAVQRFTEVLAEEAEVGAEAVHALRDANASFLVGTGALPST